MSKSLKRRCRREREKHKKYKQNEWLWIKKSHHYGTSSHLDLAFACYWFTRQPDGRKGECTKERKRTSFYRDFYTAVVLAADILRCYFYTVFQSPTQFSLRAYRFHVIPFTIVFIYTHCTQSAFNIHKTHPWIFALFFYSFVHSLVLSLSLSLSTCISHFQYRKVCSHICNCALHNQPIFVSWNVCICRVFACCICDELKPPIWIVMKKNLQSRCNLFAIFNKLKWISERNVYNSLRKVVISLHRWFAYEILWRMVYSNWQCKISNQINDERDFRK